jgi:site-specific recombinase
MQNNEFSALLRVDGRKADANWLKAFLAFLSSGSAAQILEKHPELNADVQQSVWEFFEGNPARTLLAKGDLNLEGSLVSSFFTRLLGKFLPPAPRDGSLPDQVRLALRRSDWLSSLEVQDVAQFCRLLSPPEDSPQMRSLKGEVWAALDLATHRLAAQGIDSELSRHTLEKKKQANPFLEQARELGRLLEEGEPNDAHLLVLLNQCEEQLTTARKRAFRHGTSTHFTYVLVSTHQSIERIRLLLDLAQGRLDEQSRAELFLRLAVAEKRRNSIRDVCEQHFRVLLWKITVNAGETGHHYIAETSRQLLGMFRAAAGAGCIIALLALIKVEIAGLHLPIFFEALFYGLNYGIGFVLIHLCGLAIATKQPAMTAAALANTLSEDWNSKGQPNLRGVAEKCWHTVKSQVVAIAGNVVFALPVACLLSWLWSLKFGSPPATPEKAAHLIHDLDPFHSLALFHAAIAGVGLFLTGLVSGYFDNLSAYLDLPGRLLHASWLGRYAESWSNYARSETGALVGNLALGFYLGGVGGFGQIVGLPLDIRHVAFASANFGLSIESMTPTQGQFGLAFLGVLLIGAVNLFVSFGLAVSLALMARGLGWDAVKTLLHQLVSLARREEAAALAPAKPG